MLERQHDLEQWMPGERACRVEHFDEAFERQVLVVIGGEIGRAHPPDQFAETRVAGGVGAQHQGVDEEPHQIVQRAVRPSGDRAADRDVRPRTQPRQQRRKPRLQHHEQARLTRPRQPHKPLMQRWLDAHRDRLAVIARHRRARTVGRQIELIRQLPQRRRPEPKLPCDRAVRVVLAAENLVLP